jgi:hypothetical protein
VDAYLDATDLVEVVLAVGRNDIPVRILSSRKELVKDVAGGGSVKKGEVLLSLRKRLHSEQHLNGFEIRVMSGKDPMIHDRFLALDDRLWLLGSSLNNFGARGTMMLAVPDPEPVLSALEEAWNESEPLEAWLERLRKNDQNQRAGGPAT